MQSTGIMEPETPSSCRPQSANAELQMKKVSLPDCAEVNATPCPAPESPNTCSGSEYNCLIFKKKERRQKMPVRPLSFLLRCPAKLWIFSGPAVTLWALAGGELDHLSLLEGLGL